MPTIDVNAILTQYPVHLQGSAYVYAAEHDGTLPDVKLLARIHGSPSRVGAAETSKHAPQWVALWAMVPVAYDPSKVDDDSQACLEFNQTRLDAIRSVLGSTLADLLASGHSVSEACRLTNYCRRKLTRRLADIRENFMSQPCQ
jgi:hypothetical protein